MSKLLASNTAECVCPAMHCGPTCKQCIMEWLKQPAEGE